MTPHHTLSRPSSLHARASALLLLVVLLFASVAPWAAGQTITWSVVPADESGPDGRISLRHEVEPGTVVNDAIAVANTGDVAATFTVSVGDGVVGANGAFDIDDQSTTGAGGWVTVDGTKDGALTLEPGDSRVLPVAIAVPEDALPGDHPAGIAVAVVQGTDVQISYRVGVRLHLRVPGKISPALTLGDVSTDFQPSWIPFAPGRLSVTYDLTNEGNVRLGASGEASAAAVFGLGASGSDTDELVELLPGETSRRTVVMDAPSLFWLGGDLEVRPQRVGEDAVTPPGAQTVSFGSAAVSWTGVGLLVLVLGAGTVWLMRRRRGAAAAAPAAGGHPQDPAPPAA